MANLRLLVCYDCKSTDIVSDYEGDPAHDTALEYCTDKHRFPNNEKHFGKLFKVDEDTWNHSEAREEILRQLWKKAGHTGLEPWVYQFTDQLKTDAMACWSSRKCPDTCSDFHSDKKILVPPTADERKAEGMKKWDKSNPAAQRYLCDYCPIRSIVEQKIRAKRGLYK